ncbi:hypothetical protein [Knoellia koreensis]|jgi:hypothetical protein|uniref:PknH-like extracellular domain-containing protein n=1 Tax=Knoellia koreensis TaxID=2730921 RepID=A0A849HEI9_9MICO|nr:hypothetical protein [Knoellia sp. DB2414S]NNM45063.1 hypothetical protein [Knoellia sp. DB2414S]
MSRTTFRTIGAALLATATFAGGATSASAARGIPDVAPDTMAGQPMQYDFGNYANTPTATGAQICDPANEGATMPRNGRQWTYYDGTNSLAQLTADLTITSWKNAEAALADVAANTGMCSLDTGWRTVAWTGQDPSTHLLLTNGDDYAALAVEGKYVVAVVATDWDGRTATLAEARAAAIDGVEATLANL